MSTAVGVFFSLLFFIGGIALFGYFEFFVGGIDLFGYFLRFELVAFFAGILAISIAMIIPAHLLKRIG